MKDKNKTIVKFCAGLTLVFGTTVHANWGNSMPFGGQSFSQPQQMQPFGGSMPWGGQNYNQSRYQQPRYNSYNRGGSYQAPQSNPFDGMGMPFGGMSQPQQQYRQPQSSFMMPGMDQGMRSMMEPGKIMAEEATPGMYMKPTWR
ncbi:hypothetical protein [Candidatus Thioglobus sp.]|jgi:hypothetical protein|uniref:hypothetical protein n=1 Tax=Candidatus Thioglobus sp. TaxID=2026721 RepID=UPI001EBD66BE|nr:hypothetical protein [Candidatus Thioglobus sp.]MBT3186194.1 hypothetical protein [Candidatus Thioglobus sp.]